MHSRAKKTDSRRMRGQKLSIYVSRYTIRTLTRSGRTERSCCTNDRLAYDGASERKTDRDTIAVLQYYNPISSN